MTFVSTYLKLRWEIDCIQRQNEVGEAHLRLPKDSADTRKCQRDRVWVLSLSAPEDRVIMFNKYNCSILWASLSSLVVKTPLFSVGDVGWIPD